MPPKLGPRKLLVASIGVATINYVATACGGLTDVPTSANLPAPPAADGGMDALVPPPTSANLPAPPPTSANLPAPPPIDAGDDADAADGSDAG